MKAQHLLFLLYAATCYGQSNEPEQAQPLSCIRTDNRPNAKSAFENASQAIDYLNTAIAPLSPETRQRLTDVWNLKTQDQRIEALHKWIEETRTSGKSTDAASFLIIDAQLRWNNHFCHEEQSLFYQHLTQSFQTDNPVNNTRTRHWLDYLSYYTPCRVDEIIPIMDAVNERPLQQNLKSYNPYMINIWRIWTEPVGYASSIMSGKNDGDKNKLNYILHNYDALLNNHVSRGLVRWRYAYGQNLPEGVVSAMRAMKDRHEGILPTPATLENIGRQARELESELQGFIPRCKLAVDPAAEPWISLDNPEATLFQMPDTSAVTLPQWNPTLAGAADSLEQACGILQKLAEQASNNGTLQAVQAFALAEGELALPKNYWHSWLGVEGYDTYKYTINSIYKPDGVDITITNTGARFSRNDAILQKASRDLSVALHRCILHLASLEHAEKADVLAQGCSMLAHTINRYDLWPLLCSEYELRGISPEAYSGLIREFKGKPEMLNAFAASAGMHGITLLSEAIDRGNVTATHMASLMREFFILNSAITATEEERRRIARSWFEQAKQHNLPTITQFLCLKGYANLINQWQDIPSHFVSNTYAYTGYKLVKQALDTGDAERASFIYNLMTQDPRSYSQATTRLAKAALEQAEGNVAATERAVADAVILAAIQTGRNDFQAYIARRALIDDGRLVEVEKILTLLRWKDNRFLQRYLMEEFARAGQYESAAFQAGSMMHLACINSTPVTGLSSQADIVELRIYADTCRALSLLRQGEPAKGHPLLETALQQMLPMPELAAKLAPVILSCQSLPPAQREKIKQRLLSAWDKTQKQADRIALGKIARTPVKDLIPAPEITGASGEDYDRYPKFTSKTYDWHLILPGGTKTELFQAAIVMADYETPHNKWVYLRNEQGRTATVFLNTLLPEDIDNIIDWKRQNNIHTWTEAPSTDSLRYEWPPLDGTLVYKSTHLIGAQADIDDGNTPYILVRRPTGNIQRLTYDRLREEDRNIIEKWKQPALSTQDTLRTFPSWKRALAYAECNHLLATAYVLGKRGGPEEDEFKKQILDDPNKIDRLNRLHAVVICYQNENGEWDENAKEIFRLLRPTIESISPPGSNPDNNPYTSGFYYTYGRNHAIYGASFRQNHLSAEELDFEQAIEQADTQKVSGMLAQQPNLLRTRFSIGTLSPLCVAIRHGHHDIARILLEHGAEADSRDPYGYTMLYTACLYRNVEIVKLLLQHGADPDLPTYQHMGFDDDLIPRCPISGCGNHPEICRILLDAGANPNASRNGGPSPLVQLTGRAPKPGTDDIANTTACINMLLQAGADVHAEQGRALSNAVINNRPEWVKSLLAAGADPNGKGDRKDAPLHIVREPEIFHLLLQAGAVIDPDDPYTMSNAVSNGLRDCVAYLVERGARIDIHPEGQSLLQWAARGTTRYETDFTKQKKRIAAIIATSEYLISKGLNVNETDKTGTTLLAYARKNAAPAFIDMLLRHGALDQPVATQHKNS